MSDPFTRLAGLADIGPTRKLKIDLPEESVLLVRSEGQVYAFRNVCTHLGQPLHAGRLMAGQIHCPYHGACFEIRTGRAMSGPAVAPLRCYPVQIRAGDIYVNLAEPFASADVAIIHR